MYVWVIVLIWPRYLFYKYASQYESMNLFLCSTYQMLDEDEVSTSDHCVSMIENSQLTDDYTEGSTPTLGATEKKEKAKVT